MESSHDHIARRQAGVALKNQGDELTRLGGGENLAKAVRLCDEAIAMLKDQPFAEDGSDRDELASAWMKRGLALLGMGAPEALVEAIRSFDTAIELRKKLPFGENPRFRYGLGAGWINRGKAFTRLGGAENLDEAVHSHTEAIAMLETLPLEEDALYLKRLAIAWINHGVAWESKMTGLAFAEAVKSYQNVIDLISHSSHADDAEFRFILAGALLNSGNASLHVSGDAAAPETCAAMEKALSRIAETESKELEAAEISFKARHVLCRATLVMLAANNRGTGEQMDFISKITDTVEDGMRLAREWERAGVTHFRPLAKQFFHVGALVYERHQPQFLAEFLLDHLDTGRATCVMQGSNDWHPIAEESLSRVRHQIHNLDFGLLATPRGKQWIGLLDEVRNAESRLREVYGT